MRPELKSKLKLSFLLLITALPVSVATISFNTAVNSGRIGGTVNNGVLIQPPADITVLEMRDEEGDPQFRRFEEMIEGIQAEEYQPRPWLMVYVTAQSCAAECQQRIHYLKQLHITLGKNMPRVRRYYLHVDEQAISPQQRSLLREQYQSMGLAFASRENIQANLRSAGVEIDLRDKDYVFLVDPVGNVMMYYTDEHSHEQIKADLDRLLKYSSLG